MFTDIFIKRPVLAIVVSLLILLVGARAYQLLTVREYPETQNAKVTVTTAYPGASADLVKGFITTPIEREVASANGIDYLESSSIQGLSTVTAHLNLNYDPNEALTEISSKVDRVRSELPDRAEDPGIDLSVGETTSSMYLSFHSDQLDGNQITDYLRRVVQPKLESVDGVERAGILGARTFAMRIWLKPERMDALNVTAGDVREVLAANNYLAAVGNTKGPTLSVALTAGTNVTDPKQFEQLVVAERDGAIVRLSDVAEIKLGAENYDTSVFHNEQTATFIGVDVTPKANPLTVAEQIRARFPKIKAAFPQGLEGEVVYDVTEYIDDAINEVGKTLGEAVLIVIVVMFLFLGSFRAIAVPVMTIPLSLIGVGFIMLAMGYSVNLLTLLAMILGIGLVVDDAIIVVENIHRHVEEGLSPFDAAIKGARELAGPVVAMTITLAAVYAPIGFTGGLTGALFQEFAFTLAGAVIISGVVALTLSPMMCSRLFTAHTGNGGGLMGILDAAFDRLRRVYEWTLHQALKARWAVAAVGLAVLASCYVLYGMIPTELAPDEDQGIIIAQSTAQPNASIDQLETWMREQRDIYQSFPETRHVFLLNGLSGGSSQARSNTAIAGMNLKPWTERARTSMELKPLVQQKLGGIAGVQAAAFIPPPLPGGGSGLPVQFVVGAIEDPRQVHAFSQQILGAALKSPKFVFAKSDLQYDRGEVNIKIDRTKARSLGIDMRALGIDLASMLGGGDVNRFALQGRSYKVIPQVVRAERVNAEQILDYKVRTKSGELIPVSTFASLERVTQPRKLNRFQQLNAATISALPAPGVSMGEAVSFFQQQADQVLPPDYTVDYAGASRQYVQEGSALVFTFFFALLTIYLVLAAQFESFRDPLIMLVSVPMSISGALAFMALGFASMNVYTQIGLVTLIGVISKHGILLVQFANQLQTEGHDKRTAIEHAAGIRLRPILMTTAALVFAMVPLLIATGPGAVSRFHIGVVIAAGMTIGTIFTLYVVPAIYTFVARTRVGAS